MAGARGAPEEEDYARCWAILPGARESRIFQNVVVDFAPTLSKVGPAAFACTSLPLASRSEQRCSDCCLEITAGEGEGGGPRKEGFAVIPGASGDLVRVVKERRRAVRLLDSWCRGRAGLLAGLGAQAGESPP